MDEDKEQHEQDDIDKLLDQMQRLGKQLYGDHR